MDAKLKSFILKVKKEHDDDAVDRAVYATTLYMLAFFAILLMAKQYVGEPLQVNFLIFCKFNSLN